MKFEFDCSELTNFANELKNTSKFDKSMKNTAKEISKVLLKRMKFFWMILEQLPYFFLK